MAFALTYVETFEALLFAKLVADARDLKDIVSAKTPDYILIGGIDHLVLHSYLHLLPSSAC